MGITRDLYDGVVIVGGTHGGCKVRKGPKVAKFLDR